MVRRRTPVSSHIFSVRKQIICNKKEHLSLNVCVNSDTKCFLCKMSGGFPPMNTFKLKIHHKGISVLDDVFVTIYYIQIIRWDLEVLKSEF